MSNEISDLVTGMGQVSESEAALALIPALPGPP